MGHSVFHAVKHPHVNLGSTSLHARDIVTPSVKHVLPYQNTLCIQDKHVSLSVLRGIGTTLTCRHAAVMGHSRGIMAIAGVSLAGLGMAVSVFYRHVSCQLHALHPSCSSKSE
eukprot:2800183-Rhodomonas_salina.3